ncbi:hypothetical protein EYF80_004446 [Liparis tanakae]|uniref:Uncharacterized protein n=1 Tax=Liparis tanakae TaxID=230148 RepID=A0A4Z2J6C8_9TELE|nr:hypothetical protein EYF80_004446 [Liparis tanakae]
MQYVTKRGRLRTTKATETVPSSRMVLFSMPLVLLPCMARRSSLRHIYPVHGEIDRGNGIDPAQRHGGEVRHQDDGNTEATRFFSKF